LNRAVFFDRDGVLNKLVFRDGNYYSPRNIEKFQLYNDAEKVIHKIRDKGYLTIIVSNQPDIARGFLKKSVLNEMTKKIYDKLSVDDIFYCMHDDPDAAGCRKPDTGLIIKAQKKWDLDLRKSIMIGDSEKDYGAAKNAGIKFILMSRSHNKHMKISNRISTLSEIEPFLN
jgi:D-glycero-D-manno-heptose 1,7-bisphosphate phosphatase